MSIVVYTSIRECCDRVCCGWTDDTKRRDCLCCKYMSRVSSFFLKATVTKQDNVQTFIVQNIFFGA